MPSTVCGWCGRFAHMEREGDARVIEVKGSLSVSQAVVTCAYSCSYCRRLSLAQAASVRQYIVGDAGDWLDKLEDHLQWLPPAGYDKEFPDVPARIADGASEVHLCLATDAPRAAVALARAVLEATAKDRGIEKGNLESKINQLQSLGLIRQATSEAAHELRLNGNEVAHGDLVSDPITLDEARDVVALLDEVLQDVYQGPARMARVRANRAARSSAPTSEA